MPSLTYHLFKLCETSRREGLGYGPVIPWTSSEGCTPPLAPQAGSAHSRHSWFGGFHSHGGTQRWLIRENPTKMDDDWVYFHELGNLHFSQWDLFRDGERPVNLHLIGISLWAPGLILITGPHSPTWKRHFTPRNWRLPQDKTSFMKLGGGLNSP